MCGLSSVGDGPGAILQIRDIKTERQLHGVGNWAAAGRWADACYEDATLVNCPTD